MAQQVQSQHVGHVLLRPWARQAQVKAAAQHAAERRVARQVDHLAIPRIAIGVELDVVAEADAGVDGRRHVLVAVRGAQARGVEGLLRGVEFQPGGHRRQVGQRLHRVDRGADIAFAAPPGAVPATMLDMVVRVPPLDVLGGLEELAQLGFVGIILDGKGTPGRGRKFHHYAYENIHGCAGLADHVYVLPQLKELYPFIDLERLGIWGNSGGGCATSRAMLEYPDTYKVGVSSAGNHDQRMYSNIWTENYYGLYKEDIYLKGDNTALAKNLKGKLFIAHGAMDDNVAMSESMRLVDALVKADKDFDFLILPRCNHNVPADPYFIRRKLDYFVRYLLGEEVPEVHFHKA